MSKSRIEVKNDQLTRLETEFRETKKVHLKKSTKQKKEFDTLKKKNFNLVQEITTLKDQNKELFDENLVLRK